MGVPIADKIGLKSGQTLTIVLWILLRPYKTAGLDPAALIFLYCLSLRLVFKTLKFQLYGFHEWPENSQS